MDGVALLREARSAGLTVTRNPDGRLTVRGPRLAGELALRLLSHKTEVLAALQKLQSPGAGETRGPADSVENAGSPRLHALAQKQRSPALCIWKEALQAVSAQWRDAALARRARSEEPPWLASGVDEDLEAEVANAIRAGDVEKTRRRVAAWQLAWEGTLAADTTRNPCETAAKRGFCPEGRQDALVPELRARLEARARDLDAEALFRLVEDEDLAAAEHEIYSQEIYARADRNFAESQGRIRRPNQSVWDMLDRSARRWPGTGEERSITAWLQKNAPEVAALWPEAPLEAAWYDWRLRVGPDVVPQLDLAWRAVCLGATRGQNSHAPDGKVRDDHEASTERTATTRTSQKLFCFHGGEE